MIDKSLKPDWLSNKDIRPYVFARKENRPQRPGTLHSFPWFKHNYIVKDPITVNEADFGYAIMNLDASAFGQHEMVTPPWVFYDCGVLPGIISGFAIRSKSLSPKVRKILKVKPHHEWTPISMFIIIPTGEPKTWMAHNLASVNGIMPRGKQFRNLGFLTKAFGLWYANVKNLYGVTQWHSKALKLHPCFGQLRLLTTYTPLHDYSNSVTYACEIDSKKWPMYLVRPQTDKEFSKKFEPVESFNPKDEKEIRRIQKKIETKKNNYYISAVQILHSQIGDLITIYKKHKPVRK